MTMDETFRFDSPNASASTAVQGLIERRLDAAAYEMEHTTVTQNAVIWKLYDHGFVVRTSGFTVAFDMVRGWVANDPEVNTLTSRIVSQCDALFVSNKYAEHADTWVRDAFLSQSKPVIAPASVYSGDGRITRLARDGVTLHTVTMPGGRSLQVIMYPGRCGSDENNIPLIVAPGGLKFGHAGDQDNAGDFAWIDVIKNSHDVAFLMVNTAPAQRDRLVKGFDPRVALTGHENDMSLNTTSRLGYFHSHDRLRQAGYPLTVMAWGDSFYYDPAQTASSASPVDAEQVGHEHRGHRPASDVACAAGAECRRSQPDVRLDELSRAPARVCLPRGGFAAAGRAPDVSRTARATSGDAGDRRSPALDQLRRIGHEPVLQPPDRGGPLRDGPYHGHTGDGHLEALQSRVHRPHRLGDHRVRPHRCLHLARDADRSSSTAATFCSSATGTATTTRTGSPARSRRRASRSSLRTA